MQTIIEEVRQALQQGRFDTCHEVIGEALGATPQQADRLVLLELLAEAQTGLDDSAAAANTWEQAYHQASSPTERARLFERACQGYEQAQNLSALERLAQVHGRCANTPHEHAKSLLIAGEALMRQRQYCKARERYFKPALDGVDIRPELRAYLWYDVGLCYLTEQEFAAAAEAFRASLSIPLAVWLPTQLPTSPAHLISVQQLQNAAHFYSGVIHLMHHQPDQAVRAIKKVQPSPRTGAKLERANTALFLALAHCRLQQPDAAEHALRSLPSAAALPHVLHGPQALIRAGIANLRQDTAAVGEYIEKALGASLRPQANWAPSWRALAYEELGQVLYRMGFRQAAIAADEEALKGLVYRLGPWRDALYMDWLRGHSLFVALENLPLHTWPVSVGGDMLRLLQRLLGRYDRATYGTLPDLAFKVALRLPTTPMQRASLWLHYGWLLAIRPSGSASEANRWALARAECVEGVQTARVQCPNARLALALRGIEALLNGHEAVAQHAFAQVADMPEAPEVRALCVATWLWAHAGLGQLGQVLGSLRAESASPWPIEALLPDVFMLLLDWASQTASPVLSNPETWLVPLWGQHPVAVQAALRTLDRPDALTAMQRQTLRQLLTRLCTPAVRYDYADEAASLLGGKIMLDRIDVLLAALDQCQTPDSGRPQHPAQRRKTRHRKRSETAPVPVPHGARLCHLIERLPLDTSFAAQGAHLPETIHRWLVQHPDLGSRAPEVVGALLRRLARCALGHTVIPAILAQVTLSKRQRQALESASPALSPVSAPSLTLADWHASRDWSLTRLLGMLSALTDAEATPLAPHSDAYTWHLLGLVFCRIGLHARASECLQRCVSLHPENPLASYQLAHLLRQQQRHEAALHHALTAWRVAQAQVTTEALLHLEILNLLFVLLGMTARDDDLPGWFATFERCCDKLKTVLLSDEERQQLREEEGRYTLARALHLSSLPPRDQTSDNLERQLDFLAQAIAQGPPPTRHFAWHREANVLRRLQREDDAMTTYMKLIEQWPDDRRARFRLSLLTAVRQAAADDHEADRALAEALALAFADVVPTPSPLTPQSAFDWWQRAAPYSASFVDVTDILTAYGHMLLKRRAYTQTIAMLTLLYTRVAEPRQAYFLAQAHYARSLQETSEADRQRECQCALGYVKVALASDALQPLAHPLLQQIEAEDRRLTAAKRRVTALAAYRQQVSAWFTRYGVCHEAHLTEQPPEAPWLAIYEHAALEETSGNPMVTVQLHFNRHAHRDKPAPSMQEVMLYAQHQQAAQQIVQRHGVTSLTWPQITYGGETPFDYIFSERLALNRDLLVVAHAEPKTLVRYARLLLVMFQQLESVTTTSSPADLSALMAVARHLVVAPLVHQRLHAVESSAPSTQSRMLPASSASAAFVERYQKQQAFADAYLYFDAIATAMRDALHTPFVHPPLLPVTDGREPRQNKRVEEKKQRDGKAKRKRPPRTAMHFDR